MKSPILKKFQKAFYAAQGSVHGVFKDAGLTCRCLDQPFNRNGAIEIFSLHGEDRLGIVAVRYMYGIDADEPCAVFFFYDEGLVGKLAGAKEFGTWKAATDLLNVLMPVKIKGDA